MHFGSFETDLTILGNRKGISLPQLGHWAEISTWPNATVRSRPTWPCRHSSAGPAWRGSVHEGAPRAACSHSGARRRAHNHDLGTIDGGRAEVRQREGLH
jgi:hypothetical protein